MRDDRPREKPERLSRRAERSRLMMQAAASASPVVFVVDDDIDVREGLKALLEWAGLRCEVSASTREFVERRASDAVSCLILDVRMPGSSGLDLQRQLSPAGTPDPDHLHHGPRRYPDDGAGDEGRRGRIPHQTCREQALLDAVQRCPRTRSCQAREGREGTYAQGPLRIAYRSQSAPAACSCCTPSHCRAILTTVTPCGMSSRTPKISPAARSNKDTVVTMRKIQAASSSRDRSAASSEPSSANCDAAPPSSP